jgi:hypothetical protein
MPTVDFSQYFYYPDLLCGVGEHLGYRELPVGDKQNLVPVLKLSHRSGFTNFDTAVADVTTTSAARPFILDLSHEPAPPPYIPREPTEADQRRIERERQAQTSYNRALSALLNPANGFAAWREMAAQFQTGIPTLQYSDANGQAGQILRQAVLLSQGGGCIAIRINQQDGFDICRVIPQIVSILESPDRLLVIVDCDQRRTNISQRASFASEAMSRILSNIDLQSRPLIRAVCMSNSFTQPGHDGLREDYDNLDWRLWREARETFPFLYGDYAAMYRLRRQNTFVPPDWRATVVYPREEEWLVYRHPDASDPQGWQIGSAAITDHARYNPAPRVWGVQVIERAAAGNLTGIDAARFWYGAKVNIHIHRQIPFARQTIGEYGLDDD